MGVTIIMHITQVRNMRKKNIHHENMPIQIYWKF